MLVRTHTVGICHSDLDLLDGQLDAWLEIDYPLVFGHEWSGDVVEVGSSVKAVKPGDRVTGCAALGGNRWFGTATNGAAAERFIVPEHLLYRLPASMSYEQGALVEPFACAYQGIRTIGGADPSDSVCIVGAGTIGLCSLVAARSLGAEVLVIEPSANRREMALNLGADAVLDPTDKDDLVNLTSDLLQGHRPDLIIEAAGAPAALATALQISSQNGRVLFLGHCAASETRARVGLTRTQSAPCGVDRCTAGDLAPSPAIHGPLQG